MENKIISPCISICRTDPVTGYCYGCARTNDEKRNWKDENTPDDWKMKNLDDASLLKYLAKIKTETLLAYGVYQIEADGLELFEYIKGDQDSIMDLKISEI